VIDLGPVRPAAFTFPLTGGWEYRLDDETVLKLMHGPGDLGWLLYVGDNVSWELSTACARALLAWGEGVTGRKPQWGGGQ
jgi:hypothetical protein